MIYFDKSKFRSRVHEVKRGSTSSVRETDLPLDHQLTFNRDAGEQWKYRDGHIFVNDIDVEEVLDFEKRDVGLWCAVSEGLIDYKEEVRGRGGPESGRFFGKAGAIQDKILGNMKKYYDEKTNGLCISYEDGEYLLNNFNIRAFLSMYQLRPTEKARNFLLGIRNKLALILSNKQGTPQYERVQRVVRRLYEEVNSALEIRPIETRRLTAGGRNCAA